MVDFAVSLLVIVFYSVSLVVKKLSEIPRILIRFRLIVVLSMEMLVELNLATIISNSGSGVLFIVFDFNNTEISIVVACFALSPTINGISGLIIVEPCNAL